MKRPKILKLLILVPMLMGIMPQSYSSGAGAGEAKKASASNGGLISARKLIGTDVGTLEGRDGHINDLIIDREEGRVALVAIETEGAFGTGFTRYVAPWEVLDLKGADHSEWIRLHVDISKMKKASSRLPYMTERDFVREVLQFYGFRPYWYE